ncbi:MAG: ATP-dependent metallopeptidase FtsH/Yme1/Tma family protein, partial [Cyanobacteria bacterium P01_A01_bin.135]
MKFSWRTVILWALPILIIGFFIWQSAFAAGTPDTGRNAASSRMTYGRFLGRLDAGQITSVDFYDGGRTAIVEVADANLGGGAARARVDLPGNAPDLVSRLKSEGIRFDTHAPRNDGVIWGFLGNLIFPLLLIGGLFLLFRRSS